MKLRKYIRKYMTVFLLLCLLFTVNVVPIGAIIASGGSTGGGDYNTTNKSTFPVTVGFGYRIIPGTGQSPTMVFNNEFGGFGQELQAARFGQDYYEFTYPTYVGGPYNNQAKGVYYYRYLDVNTSAYSIPYVDGSYNSAYYFGYQNVLLNNSAFFADPYDPDLAYMNNREGAQQCITFKARDVVYNTHYLYDFNGNDVNMYDDPRQAMMPCMTMFNNDNMLGFENDNAYYVYEYNWEVKFVDAYGNNHSYNGGWYHNTRDDPQTIMSLIPLNIMQKMIPYGHSIVIDDFTGVLSATYYERPSSNVINGTWVVEDGAVDSPLFQYDHSGSIDTAACDVLPFYNGQSYSMTSGLCHSSFTLDGYNRDFITNGGWGDSNKRFACLSGTDVSPDQFYSADMIEISNWDYANNANTLWWYFLNDNYNQVEQGAPDPNQSTKYVAKGLAGKGLTLHFYYPLFNGDHVVNTGSEIYKQYYDDFGFPYFAKYVKEYGTRNPVSDDIPIYEGSDMSSWLVGAVGGFLGFELWPGFSLVNILSVCVAIPLLLWILKLFAGG